MLWVSDAPDDYVALRELKDKPDFRAKFKLTDEMVRRRGRGGSTSRARQELVRQTVVVLGGGDA